MKGDRCQSCRSRVFTPARVGRVCADEGGALSGKGKRDFAALGRSRQDGSRVQSKALVRGASKGGRAYGPLLAPGGCNRNSKAQQTSPAATCDPPTTREPRAATTSTYKSKNADKEQKTTHSRPHRLKLAHQHRPGQNHDPAEQTQG